jgi:3-keto-disaccharide hydrolase
VLEQSAQPRTAGDLVKRHEVGSAPVALARDGQVIVEPLVGPLGACRLANLPRTSIWRAIWAAFFGLHRSCRPPDWTRVFVNSWGDFSMKKAICLAVAGWCLMLAAATADEASGDGWVSLFDGKSLEGWKANENPGTFSVKDGEIVAHGPRSHLFYVGPVENHDFKNFHFKTDVMTLPQSNSGIYFHSEYQEGGWPAKGYEVQVNNTHRDPKKTGGLYGVKDNFEAPAEDGKWFTEEIIVRGKHIVVKVDGKTITDFTEPENFQAPGFPGRKVDHGTFALQGHDPVSEVHYKNLLVKPLTD